MAFNFYEGEPQIRLLVVAGIAMIVIGVVGFFLPHTVSVNTTVAGVALLVGAIAEGLANYFNPGVMTMPTLALAIAALDAAFGILFVAFTRTPLVALSWKFGLVVVVYGLVQMVAGRLLNSRGLRLAPAEALGGLLICLMGVMVMGDILFAWFAYSAVAIIRGVSLISAGHEPSSDGAGMRAIRRR